MRRVLLLLCLAASVPAICFGIARFSLNYQGSPREAQRQAEELGEGLRRFLSEHREELESLRAAAGAGQPLPSAAQDGVLNGSMAGADVNWVGEEDGRVLVQMTSRHPGLLYTTLWLGSGDPPLPDGTAQTEGQTFWTLDRYHRIERLEEGWYAEYFCYPRG